jgi:peptidoglycan/LPS O-acetylase OafA/YrhL
MYFKQIDSFRFFAVLLVLFSHWLSGFPLVEKLRLGAIGVEIFFVISGFLISLQLYQYKRLIDEKQSNPRKAIFVFYARRFLRIFPLYYFILILATSINSGEIRTAAAWNFSYASNFYFIKVQHWTSTFSHFWSLSVEEHFYLVWPFFILLMRRSYLPYLFVSLCSLSIYFRYTNLVNNSNFFVVYAHTLSCIDLFVLGGILAFLYEYKKALFNHIFQNHQFRLLVIITYAVLYAIWYFLPELATFNWAFQRFFQGVVFASIIGFLVIGLRGRIGAILSHKLPVHLGKLSYGIYLTHNFVPGILLPIRKLDLPVFIEFSIYLITTIMGSELLYRFIETPIRNLNRHFKLNAEEKHPKVTAMGSSPS